MRRLILSLLVLGLLFALFVATSRYNAGTMDNQDIAALIVQVGALVLVGAPSLPCFAAAFRRRCNIC